MRPDDLPHVQAMMHELCPDEPAYDFSQEHVFVWQRDGISPRDLGGFISISLRPWAEGCESAPVPYVEGWWVAPDLRRSGIGRALMSAAEQWCGEHGYQEVGSDAELANDASQHAHASLGFDPTLRLQYFRKRL